LSWIYSGISQILHLKKSSMGKEKKITKCYGQNE